MLPLAVMWSRWCATKGKGKWVILCSFVTIKLWNRNTDVLDVKLLCALIQLHSWIGTLCLLAVRVQALTRLQYVVSCVISVMGCFWKTWSNYKTNPKKSSLAICICQDVVNMLNKSLLIVLEGKHLKFTCRERHIWCIMLPENHVVFKVLNYCRFEEMYFCFKA